MSTNERECARGRRRSVNAVAVTERERSSGDGARARMMKRAVPLHLADLGLSMYIGEMASWVDLYRIDKYY